MAPVRRIHGAWMGTVASATRLVPILLLAVACASPRVVVTPPAPGVPLISALEIAPAKIEEGCSVMVRLQFEDTGADVIRALARWRARTAAYRHHDGTDVLPFAVGQLHGKSDGRADVMVVPPHPGNYIYRIQLEDAEGQTSNVAEARVYVEIRPFWRKPRCQAPSPGAK